MYGAKAEKLMVWNPLLNSNLKKYIWISDSQQIHEKAQHLFTDLLMESIYIDGFVSDADVLINLSMYHKKVFDIRLLNSKNSVVFYDSFYEDIDAELADKGHSAKIINPNIGGEDIVIWGAGATGRLVYKILEDQGIRATCFVDSDKNLVGKSKCGLWVYGPDILDKSMKDSIVIEALEKWEQVDEIIREKHEKRFYFSIQAKNNEAWNNITYKENGVEKKLFPKHGYYSFNFFEGKKVFIYGTGIAERTFAKCLELLDFEFAGFLVDEMDSSNDQCYGYPIKYIEDILYESNFYIWIHEREKCKKLKEMGLKYFEEYIHGDYCWDISIAGNDQILDINLGHTRLNNDKYPGISIYGHEDKDDYRIAVLGGSTSDGSMYSFDSWSKQLYKMLEEKRVTIYNCGVIEYTSSQELIKLIRDVLPLKPDMIIVYDGYNDSLLFDDRFPFSFNYLRQIFNFAANSLADDMEEYTSKDNHDKFYSGVRSLEGRFGNWLANIRTMHAIAQDRNIKFFCFCQPYLSSKKGKSIMEKNMLLSIQSRKIDRLVKESLREYIHRKRDLPDYIYDLSHIFDGENDIYMDVCHVWQKGNQIIAQEIEKIIGLNGYEKKGME